MRAQAAPSVQGGTLFFAGGRSPLAGLRGHARDAQEKLRALPEGAARGNAAIKLFDDQVVDDVQAQSRAALPPPGREKGIEDAVDDLGGDAGAVVGHFHFHHLAAHAGAHVDAPALVRAEGVLDTIEQQVGQDLGKGARVRVEGDVKVGAAFAVRLVAQHDLRALQFRPQAGDDLVHVGHQGNGRRASLVWSTAICLKLWISWAARCALFMMRRALSAAVSRKRSTVDFFRPSACTAACMLSVASFNTDALVRTMPTGVLTSWATPATRPPSEASRSACSSDSWVRRKSAMAAAVWRADCRAASSAWRVRSMVDLRRRWIWLKPRMTSPSSSFLCSGNSSTSPVLRVASSNRPSRNWPRGRNTTRREDDRASTRITSSSSTSSTLRASSDASAALIWARLKYTITLPTVTGRMVAPLVLASRNTSSASTGTPAGFGPWAVGSRRPSGARTLPANKPTALS